MQPETLKNSLFKADKMKLENNHKINNPQDYILYNTELSYHIDRILEMI